MSIKDDDFVPNAAPQCDSIFLNSVRLETNNLVINTGQTLNVDDLNQLGQAVAVMSAGGDFYTDGGSANHYVLSGVGFKSVPPAYFIGMRVRFFPAFNNTGACDVNVNGLGVINIKARNGSSTPASADITAGRESYMTFNGTNFVITL